MNKIQFDRLDLNLLRILDLLLEHASIVEVATRLAVTPSAISHALGRLRAVLDDRLFVRRGNRLEPTPKAVEIGPRLRAALGNVRFALDDNQFDPATTDREYGLLGHAYVTATILPQIARKFSYEAPTACLRYTSLGHIDAIAELQSGRADAALGTAPMRNAQLVFEELFSDEFVWVMRADHPLASRRLSLDGISSNSHVVVESLRPVYGDEPTGMAAQKWRGPNGLEGILAEQGLAHAVGASAPDTLTAMAMITQSDMIALLPRRCAEAFNSRHQLNLAEPPHPTSEMKFGMCYHSVRAQEGAIAWFLDLLRGVARQA